MNLLLRNFAMLGAGEILSRLLHILTIMVLARRLGPDSFGTFELAVTIMSYATLVIQQGFDTIAMRDVARRPDSARDWVRVVLHIRFCLALPLGVVVIGYALLHPQNLTSSPLLILSGLLFTCAASLRWLQLALERPVAPAFSNVASQAILLAGVLVFVGSSGELRSPSIVWLMADLVAAAVSWVAFFRSDPAPLSFAPIRKVQLVRESFPITVASILGRVMYNFDTIALAWLGHGAEIGFYLAAYRGATVASPLLGQFQNSIGPRISRGHGEPLRLQREVFRLTSAALAPGLLSAILLSLGASVAIRIVFGEHYSASIPYLRVLAWVLPLQFARAALRQVLLTGGRQSGDTRNLAVSAAVNVTLDFVLVPSLGAMGCAISTVCAEIAFFILSATSVRSYFREALP